MDFWRFQLASAQNNPTLFNCVDGSDQLRPGAEEARLGPISPGPFRYLDSDRHRGAGAYAFEARRANRLNHPAFSKFGSVTVTAAEARGWSKAWTLEETVARSFALICQSARAEPIHNRCGARTDCCRGAGLPPDFECHRIEDIELIDIALFKRKKDTAFLLRDGPTEFEVPQ